jgi:ubiquinone/menaquinone biosynthesis C-methylase UbiE
MNEFQREYWESENLNKRRAPWHICVREFVLPKIREIQKIIFIDKNTKLLDVGCGNGFFSYYFDQMCDTTGIDYSEKMIALNTIKKKYVMNARNLKFADNSFDIAFCHELLHHVDDENKVIQEMVRVAKKYVVIMEQNRNHPLIFLFALFVKEERNTLRQTKVYLENLLKKNNLKIISSFSYGVLVPNKTPKFLSFLFKYLEFRHPFGMVNIIIAEK